MPFLFSLFCRQGRDSRLRVVVIAFVLFAVMLGAVIQLQETTALLRIPTLFILTIIIALMAWAGAERRLNDSLKSYKSARFVLGIWFFQGLVQISLPLTLPAIVLSLFALLAMARLAWFAPHNKMAAFASGNKGRFGYSGPNKFGSLGAIEPLIEHSSESLLELHRLQGSSEQEDELNVNQRMIWDIFPREFKMQVIGIFGLASLLFGLFWPHELPVSTFTQIIRLNSQSAIVELDKSLHKVQISDQLKVTIQANMLIISWLGHEVSQGEYWSLATAQGEQQCAEIVFDNNNRYRPLRVDVAEDKWLSAQFSPLDTNQLLHDVAQQAYFSLCDYHLDLTGSKELLRADPVFEPLAFKQVVDLYSDSLN